MNRPLIVTFVGIPGSGKTTFARNLAKTLNAITLNSDGIRIAMWGSREKVEATHAVKEERAFGNQLTFGAMNYAAEQILSAGYSVVYDCNANRYAEREEKHFIAQKYGAISVVVRIKVPYDVSLDRIQHRDDAHDSRRISPEKAHLILERFMGEIEEPMETERVIEVNGDDPYEKQWQSFERALRNIA